MPKRVGEVLRVLREASGRPRAEIARIAKLDPSVLWRLENPREGAQPSFDLVCKVAYALGVSLDEVAVRVEKRALLPDPTPLVLIERIKDALKSLERLTGDLSQRASDRPRSRK